MYSVYLSLPAGVGPTHVSIPSWVRARIRLGFKLGGVLKQVEITTYSSKDGEGKRLLTSH